MPNELETMIRSVAPRVTQSPEALFATLQLSDEAAFTAQSRSKRHRVGWVIGVASFAMLALGTNAAAAATQTLWWSSPHQAVEQMIPVSGDPKPATSVEYVLSATFAAGADDNSATAKSAFQVAQGWLDEHPVIVAVPEAAQTLTAAEASAARTQNIPRTVALDRKAFLATQPTLNAAVAAAKDTLTSELDVYLVKQGVNPASIVVDAKTGITTVKN